VALSGATRACPAVVGPTAVGKTRLITALAERGPVEVISLDSRQIYRGLRIGTAQPTREELALCPHHLVDFVSPRDRYDAGRFRRDFMRVHEQITARGGRPVLVGGAGMYLTALREGFMDIPGSTPEKLEEVRSELDPLDDAEVRARLHRADPDSFARIHPNDRYRSQRALEIPALSGRTMTELMAEQEPDPALGLVFPTFVLERPVDELDARIDDRTGLMLERGWIAETEVALESNPADCPGLKSIGYREIVGHLHGELAAEELAPAIVRTTRQYAKRQRTWFRHVDAQRRGHPEDPALIEAVVQTLFAG
jgi:tRNA dimethylallyltransferase